VGQPVGLSPGGAWSDLRGLLLQSLLKGQRRCILPGPIASMKSLLLAIFLLILSPFSGAQDSTPKPAERFELSQEKLDEISAKLYPLVEAHLGSIVKPIKFRLVEIAELREVVYQENLVLLGHQIESEELVKTSATEFARQIAPLLLAKYDLGSHEVLVAPRNFKRLSKILKMPELLGAWVTELGS
jgi:hypothetical protein